MRTVKNEMVLKTLGTLFFVAAVLKGYHLMSQPTANQDLWSYRLFSVLQVELELVMAIWLWSNVFRRGAWSAAFACFLVFTVVTLPPAAVLDRLASIHGSP